MLTIALGIGSNVSVDGFVRGLTKSNSPLTSIPGLVSIFGQDAHREISPLSYQEYRLLSSNRNTFEWIGAARVSPVSMVTADESSVVSEAVMTSQLASLLNLSLSGVVISHHIWQNQFGGKADVQGQQVRINGIESHVSSVAPNWLEGLYRGHSVDLWISLREEKLQGVDPGARNLWVLARLNPGVSITQAQTALSRNNHAAGQIRVLAYTGMTPDVADGFLRIGTLLGFGAAAVFFIACSNVISLLLGRAFARSRDVSLRVALGASRSQLARELLSDSIVISVAGGALGTLLAVWTAQAIPVLLFEEDASRLIFAPSVFSIVAASGACVGFTIACGLLPVFVTPDVNPGTILRREGAGPSRIMARLRIVLVVSQIAGCCMLVICTACLLDGLRAALQTSTGHRLGSPVVATVQAQPQTEVDVRYFQQVEQAVQPMAGLTAIAWAGRLPGDEAAWQSFRIEPQHQPLREVKMDTAWFTADLLKLFVLPPKAGRLFGFEDRDCRVAVVNEEAAVNLFGLNTIGRTILDSAGLPLEIIGIVATKGEHAADRSRPIVYYNHMDQPSTSLHVNSLARFRAAVLSELHSAELDANFVSNSYFEAMGISVVAGQEFTDHPMPGECRIGVINREAADLYFNGNPLGAAVIDGRGKRTTIIGVVNSKPLGTFQRRAEPAIYFPIWQDSLPRMTMIAGMRETNASTTADLGRRIASVPGRGPAPIVIETLATHLAHTSLAPLRIATVILGASATIALMLSILGLFGALTDAARRRRRELAIRIALGSQRWRVIHQVLKEGVRLASAGILVGMFGSLLLSRSLARITLGGPPHLWVWLTSPLVLVAAVLLASVIPARRALILSPLKIMQDDNN